MSSLSPAAHLNRARDVIQAGLERRQCGRSDHRVLAGDRCKHTVTSDFGVTFALIILICSSSASLRRELFFLEFALDLRMRCALRRRKSETALGERISADADAYARTTDTSGSSSAVQRSPSERVYGRVCPLRPVRGGRGLRAYRPSRRDARASRRRYTTRSDRSEVWTT